MNIYQKKLNAMGSATMSRATTTITLRTTIPITTVHSRSIRKLLLTKPKPNITSYKKKPTTTTTTTKVQKGNNYKVLIRWVLQYMKTRHPSVCSKCKGFSPGHLLFARLGQAGTMSFFTI